MTEPVTEITQSKKKIALHSQLVDFLAQPEAAKKLYAERFRSEYLTESERMATAILETQFDHIARYGIPATQQQLELEHGGVTFEQPSCDLDWLIDKFQKRYAKNEAERILMDLTEGRKLANDPIGTVRALVKELGQVRDVTRRQNIMYRSSDAPTVMDDYWKMVDEMQGMMGCSTGFPELDDHFHGLKKGELWFVVGRPKRYKSWMKQKSQAAAQMQGFTTVFFPLEMGKDEQFHRYACHVSGVSWKKFKHNRLTEKEKIRMVDTIEGLNGIAPAYFFDPPRGERSVDNLVHIAKDVGADVVYIDQLKFIEPPRATDSRHYAIELICEELKDAARNFPIMVSCQFNREAESMKQMADLSKIGLSDAIGQTGDVLLGLFQNPEMRNSNLLQYGVLDARAYERGQWDLSVELTQNSNFRVVDTYEEMTE